MELVELNQASIESAKKEVPQLQLEELQDHDD